MSFFGNDAINRVNLHSGVQALADGAAAVFLLVFLLRAGISVPVTLLAEAAILIGRFLLRPAILPLAKRTGLKPLLIIGALLMGARYPILALVHGVDGALLALCIVSSFATVFYWVAYNAYYASIGDAEHRGHQVGAREALVAAANIVAPLLGAWAIVALGPVWAFSVAALVQAASVLPLLTIPNVAIKPEAPGVFKAARFGMALYATDGWFDAFYFYLWQIALFVSLSQSFPAYGGALALAGLVGAVCGPLLGRWVDAGHGRRAATIAYALAAFIVIVRAISLQSPWLAVIGNALGALLMPLLSPPLSGAIYNLSQGSPCPLRFQIASDGAWDIGCLVACLIGAALTAAHVPLAATVLLALPAVLVGALLLRAYYAPPVPAPA